jgi:hypothetical protein
VDRTARSIEIRNDDQQVIQTLRSDPTEGVICVVHSAYAGYVRYSLVYTDGRPTEEFSYSGNYRIEWLVDDAHVEGV